MSLEETKTLARHHMDLLDQRNLEAACAMYQSDAQCHGFAPQSLDLNGYQQAMSALFAAFPDSHFIVDDLVTEDDKIVIRHHLQGTHQGAFQGIDPTGKQVNVSAIGILRITNGRIAETWLNADFLGLMQQIGAIPPVPPVPPVPQSAQTVS
ncbi:MAG: ester cyclase [Ktedonobacteraceae bacterium]